MASRVEDEMEGLALAAEGEGHDEETPADLAWNDPLPGLAPGGGKAGQGEGQEKDREAGCLGATHEQRP